MIKSPLIKLARQETGYTLVEVLTALVILFIIFLPVSKICSQLLSNPGNRDRIIAINLAEEAMNRMIINKNFQNEKWTEKQQGRNYLIMQRTNREGALLHIEVSVYRDQERQPLVNFYTFRPALSGEKDE